MGGGQELGRRPPRGRRRRPPPPEAAAAAGGRHPEAAAASEERRPRRLPPRRGGRRGGGRLGEAAAVTAAVAAAAAACRRRRPCGGRVEAVWRPCGGRAAAACGRRPPPNSETGKPTVPGRCTRGRIVPKLGMRTGVYIWARPRAKKRASRRGKYTHSKIRPTLVPSLPTSGWLPLIGGSIEKLCRVLWFISQ